MKRFNLRHLIFMALCCDLGLFAKKLILPAANLITDSLHIPGGIGTSFSLMFLIIAASVTPVFGCAAIMGTVQSIIALAIGSVGSMGALAPIGYIIPGLIIDCTFSLCRKFNVRLEDSIIISSVLSSLSACLIANLIVFRLSGIVLLLYSSVACTTGAICGVLAKIVSKRIKPVIRKGDKNET